MKFLSQRDPRWAEKKLGASSLTIGRYGCTTTCCSMLSDYFGCYTSPDQIAAHKDWYTPEGLVLWIRFKFEKMKFTWRDYKRDDAKIKEALKDPNQAVILQVDNGSHWVVALSATWFGNSYMIADPWDGTKCDVIKRYKNITGAAFFQRI